MNYYRIIGSILIIIILETVMFGCKTPSGINNHDDYETSENSAPERKAGFSLYGKVADYDTFEPVPGAKIIINGNLIIYADSKGNFELPDYNSGKNLSIGVNSQYYNEELFFIDIENNTEIHTEFLIKRERVNISGKITLNSIPVEGTAEISGKIFKTDTKGTFYFKDVLCGDNNFSFYRNGRLYMEKNIVINQKTNILEIELSDFSQATHTERKIMITDDQSNPLSGIILYSDNEKWISDEFGTVLMKIENSVNEISVTVVDPKKRYIDRIERISFQSANPVFIKMGKLVPDGDFSGISGMLIAKSGKIHNKIIITFSDALTSKSVNPHADGWFSIEISHGDYDITVHDPENIFEDYRKSIKVTDESEYLNITLSEK